MDNVNACKFNTLAAARSFRDGAVKPLGIILGDDGLHWVVTLAVAERLERLGYEWVR